MMYSLQRLLLIAALAVAPVVLAAGDGGAGAQTPWPTHGWARATPADVGLDAAVLAALDHDLMVFSSEQLIATFTGWDILKDVAYDSELAERLLPAVRSAACTRPAT